MLDASNAAFRGTVIALASALAFGLTTPLIQKLGDRAGPFAAACLLYAGAALVAAVSRSRDERGIVRGDAARIASIAVLGAVLAPTLLVWGLARTSGTAASLMLNLEAVFTVALASALYREHVGRRVVVAAAIMVVGGALLVLDQPLHASSSRSVAGLAAVTGASLAWALDNALAKPLAYRNPAAVVRAKASVGATLSVVAALVSGERWPSAVESFALLLVGATGYGLSLRLYLRAQRQLGAARTASVFASAPFWGAALAYLWGEPAGVLTLVSGLAMVSALLMHMTERHAHVHTHEALEHEHPHRHDDGHHHHTHAPMPPGEHTHRHRHERVVHDHVHVPDIHHEHRHAGDAAQADGGT